MRPQKISSNALRNTKIAIFLMLVLGNAVAQSPEDFYARGKEAARRGEYAQALHHFQQAAARDAGFAKAHAALGTVHLQLGEFAAAEVALKRALEIESQNLQAAANLARLYTKTERVDAAINIYQRLIRQHPDALQVWLGLASAYQQASRFSEAIKAYHGCLRRSPKLAEAMTNLAACYEAVNQQQEAIRYYQEALALQPQLPMANGNLGAIYQEQGELDKARPLLEAALHLNPNFTAARYRFGLILSKQREFQRAAEEYRVVIAQEAAHVGAYYNLAQTLFRLKQVDAGKRAMETYRRLNAIAQEIDTRERAALNEPNNPQKQYQLGITYEKYGKVDKAIAAYQAANRLATHDGEDYRAAAFYKLGKLFFRKRNFQKAEDAYLEAIALAPAQAAPHAGLGAVYYFQERLDEAFASYKIALAHDASLATAQAGLAAIHHRRGETDEAIAAYQTALTLDAAAHYALNGLARLYIQENIQLQKAIAFAEKAFRLAPAPQYLQTLALAYAQAGEHQKALKAIRAAIQKAPHDETFHQTLVDIEAKVERNQQKN